MVGLGGCWGVPAAESVDECVLQAFTAYRPPAVIAGVWVLCVCRLGGVVSGDQLPQFSFFLCYLSVLPTFLFPSLSLHLSFPFTRVEHLLCV